MKWLALSGIVCVGIILVVIVVGAYFAAKKYDGFGDL